MDSGPSSRQEYMDQGYGLAGDRQEEASTHEYCKNSK